MNEYLVFFDHGNLYKSSLIFANSLEQVEQFLEGCDYYAINGTIYGNRGSLNTVPSRAPEAWLWVVNYCKRTERTEYL